MIRNLNCYVLFSITLCTETDGVCDEPDEAPQDIKHTRFRERWECLSKDATEVVRLSYIPMPSGEIKLVVVVVYNKFLINKTVDSCHYPLILVEIVLFVFTDKLVMILKLVKGRL